MAPNRGLLCTLLTLLLVTEYHWTVAARCDREPEGKQIPKSPVDNRFHIKISGNPDKYVPREVYTVTLQGERIQHVSLQFSGFMLTVEPMDGRATAGTFQLYNDGLAKFSDRCPNTITQTSSVRKPEVQVLWSAPGPGVGCVVFRAMVVEHPDVWYRDDGPLSRVLCEDVQESLDEQPQIVDPCCACDEAKYELAFEGLWSRHTHPKDFPENNWLTRFSDVIGASHSANYRFWEYGGISSEGLRQVAEKGSTQTLESELKNESEHIRTIIKARGISYPNITGKTFGLFRANRIHHLISVVSKIEPSPDWIVGVSGLELCLKNCSWVESKVLNLYPWDAGTDSGTTYLSTDSPTIPKDAIRRITSSFPNDVRSPFYDFTGEEMKPMARLYLTRQRLYEKSCVDEGLHSGEDDPSESSETPNCKTSEWSEWSQCSSSCGKGYKLRHRHYLNQMRAEIEMCKRQLTLNASCIGSHPSCYTAKDPRIIGEDPLCATTEWSVWSSCSVSCGRGVKTRSRRYINSRQARKLCKSELTQNEICLEEDCPNGPHTSEGRLPSYCRTTNWSDWSPCSATCGQGSKVRNRLFQMPNLSSHLQEQCNLHMVEQVRCQAELPDCDLGPEDMESVCQLEKDSGPCRGYMIRWYFDSNDRECRQFIYGSCQGNRNNFERKEDCEKACMGLKESENGTFGGIGSDSQTRQVLPGAITTPAPVTAHIGLQVDCVVSPWSDWEACSATCGKGWRTKWRKILTHPQNGGMPCPKRLLKRRKCRASLSSCDIPNYGVDDSTRSWGDIPGVGVESMTRETTGESPRLLTQDGDISVEDTDRYSFGRVVTGPNGTITGGDCVLSSWVPWTPCSQTCGPHAVQQRTRTVLSSPWGNGLPCGPRLQRRSCAFLPCQR